MEPLVCLSPFSVSCWIRDLLSIWYFLDFFCDSKDIPKKFETFFAALGLYPSIFINHKRQLWLLIKKQQHLPAFILFLTIEVWITGKQFNAITQIPIRSLNQRLYKLRSYPMWVCMRAWLCRSPESRAHPRAAEQCCTKCGGTSPCQRSGHRKKFGRKADLKNHHHRQVMWRTTNFLRC